MKASVLSLLGVAAAVSASYGETPKPSTTSTVYTTSVYTITKCASYVTDCPEKGQVTTDYISLYTTVCPAEETETKSYPASTPTGPPAPPPTYPASESMPAGPPAPPTYPASPPSMPTYPASPPSPPQSPPTYPASSPPPPPSKPAGPVYPVTTVTISTCIPTVITSVYTISETPKGYPTYPVGTGGVSPPNKPSGTGSGSSPTGGSYPYTSSKPTTVPYTGAAGANKVGGLLMAVGLVAALF